MERSWWSFVTFSAGQWTLTPQSRRAGVMIEPAVLRALLRFSAGAPLDIPEATRLLLSDAGCLEAAPGPPPLAPVAVSWAVAESLSPSARVAPVPAFVGQISHGTLLVDGRDARVHALDEVDLALLSTFDQPLPLNMHDLAKTVAEISSSMRGAQPGPVVPLDELGRRLRRLAEAGRVLAVSGFDDGPVARGARTGLRRSAPGRIASAALATVRRRTTAYPAASPARPPDPPVEARSPTVRYRDAPTRSDRDYGPIPVYAMFPADVGPNLALGMLSAAARHHDGGRLSEQFEIRRPEDEHSVLQDLSQRNGPAILLCSNYVWSIAQNLEIARAAKAIRPDLCVIHGGPSTPKYEGDVRTFFASFGDRADVAVRGEAEGLFPELLDALGASLPRLDTERLRRVPGLSFRDAGGEIVRTQDQQRIDDLGALPSPYLTGEFDHLDPSAWRSSVTFETNRGCPYGCTFCDWGSSTLSRIRSFPLERVVAEFEWAAERSFETWLIADANFGIHGRDVETTDHLCRIKEEQGVPNFLGFSIAKNTTKRFVAILDRLTRARIAAECSLALQSRDPLTLEAVRRQNISTDHYLELAGTFRRNGLPLTADLIVPLPGQTTESFVADLEFLLEHEITARVWRSQLLPNAPMNAPEYRAAFDLVADADGLVVRTSTIGEGEIETIERLRFANIVTEQFGLLRHLLRYLLWDHGVRPGQVWRALLDDEAVARYPSIAWTMHYFDLYSVPPLGWSSFYREVRRFVEETFGVSPSSALDAVLAVQRAVMPEYGRDFPHTVRLEHDYAAYYEEAEHGLWSNGRAVRPSRPLAEYPPADFTVRGDPMHFCTGQMRPVPGARSPKNHGMMWFLSHFELDSTLTRGFPDVVSRPGFTKFAVPGDITRRPAKAS